MDRQIRRSVRAPVRGCARIGLMPLSIVVASCGSEANSSTEGSTALTGSSFASVSASMGALPTAANSTASTQGAASTSAPSTLVPSATAGLPTAAAPSSVVGSFSVSASPSTPDASSSAGAMASSAPSASATVPPAASSAPPHNRDHCLEGYEPSPADATMTDGPADFVKNDQTDTTVQPAVIEWMQAHKWEAAHFEWHSVRRCNLGTSQSRINVCSHTDMIPSDQECQSDGDGLQFLAMHRHMMQSLRQLFPSNTEQFEGFQTFPQSANDVPEQWRADWRAFSAQSLANAKIADEIEKPENLERFASEGAFGRWLQCQAPNYSGLHGDLHFKWVRTRNTDHGLGNQEANIDNYMFWKLHGWIDRVWEKYRVAKGLAPDDMALQEELVRQCREMDALATLIDPSLGAPDPPDEPLPTEAGQFHEEIRPIFESDVNLCSGCHGPSGAEAGLTLGGDVSSAQIVSGLVNKPSIHGGQYKLVAPGDADQSWLYLKVAGLAEQARCVASNTASCNTQIMPPNASGHVTLSEAELSALRAWIEDDAPAPTTP